MKRERRGIIMLGIIKRFLPLSFARIVLPVCALALLATAALPERANAQTATFTASKSLCLGSPGTNNPATCLQPQDVPSGVPVFYVITVTNPAGQPPQIITFDETPTSTPSGFPLGFSAGAVSCTDQAGVNVPVSATGYVYSFNLQPAVMTPAWTVVCTISGTFLGSANNTTQQNSVDINNGDFGLKVTETVNTFVSSTAAVNADLSITKSASPTSVGTGTSTPLPANVSYTLTIKNIGPAAVDVGHWFVLHDTLALLPSSVALQAAFVSATCTVNPGPAATCLNGSQTSQSGLVMTAAPQSLLEWGYATGTLGHFDPGGAITVTINIQISAITGLSCVKVPGGDGLRNRAFFTLTNLTDHTALADTNPLNDTTPLVPVNVNTGNMTVDPNCGDGQLTITKKQTSPTPVTNPVAWGATVTYEITIKNTSVPAQTITINPSDLKDFVVEGAGTPPFKRTFISASCSSIPATICSGFAGAPQPPFNYTYYGQSNLGWNSASSLPLNPGDSVTIRIQFQYSDPDCETVPNTNPKPIFNIASITYTATPVGATTPLLPFTQYAVAQTNMMPQSPCKFVVTKKIKGSPTQNVQFGVPLNYAVSFTNNGVARNVGTVMDSVWISSSAYGTQVPFSWTAGTCNWTGNSAPPPALPAGSGTAIYTSLPPQGAPIFRFTNVFFPQGSTLTCTVTITVQRPAFNNPNCSTSPAYWVNLGLMDVTTPYNPNVTWPPSGVFTASAPSNPSPQNTNWATVDSQLPKCYNVLINKTASVNNVTPAWTFPNGPPVNYAIKVTNTGTSGALMGSGTVLAWNGLRVDDVVTPPPYNTNLINGANCVLPGWCALLKPPAPPQTSPSYAGVLNLPQGGSGIWNLTLNPPFILNQTINNCASVTPQGTFTGPDWYPNYNPSVPPTNPPKACAQVPVLPTTKLDVTKKVVNATGHTISLPSTAFPVTVACQNYPLLSSGNLTLTVAGALSLTNGSSLNSAAGTIQNVPVALGETCTVTEPTSTLPAIPLGVCGHTTAYWDTPTFTPSQTIPISASGPNAVTVTNTLRCRPNLNVTKVFVDATGSLIPIQPPAFNIKVTCGPTAIPPASLSLTPPATAASSSSPPGIVPNIPVGGGETCTVTEPVLPPIPSTAQHICGTNGASWDPPTFTPSATIPISATALNAVTVTNTLRCKTPIQIKFQVIKDVVDMTPGGANHPASPYTVTLNCNPVSSPAIVNLTAGTPVSVLAPLGAVCTPSETPPPVPAAATHACTGPAPGVAHWETPAFVPPSFTVTSTGPQIVHAINVLRCGIHDSPGTLTVLKRVTGPAGIVPPLTAFAIGVKCGTLPPTPMMLSANGSQTVVASPPNCAVSETLPPNFPTSGCPSGIARWLPPTYTPSASVTVNFGTAAAVVVNNSFQCLPIPPIPVTPPNQ
jgi:hypothetical protein